jgi:O-antigen/teichoic acid export membrane protein
LHKKSRNHSHTKYSALRFIKDFLFTSLPVLAQKSKSFLVLILLGKLGGADIYGVWQQFFTSSNFLIRITSINFSVSISRFLAKDKLPEQKSKELSSALLTVFSLSLFVGILILPFSSTFSIWIFDNINLVYLIYLLVLYIVVETMLNHYSAYLRARRRNKLLSVINTFRPLTEILVVAVILIRTNSITYAIAGAVFVEIIGLIVTFYYIHIQLGIKWKPPEIQIIKKYAYFGIPLFLVNLGHWTSAVADRYVILHFLGIEEVGIYSGAYVFGSIILLIINPLTQVLLPDFSLLFQENKLKKIIKRLQSLFKFYSFIGLNLLTVIIFLGSFLLYFFTSRDFLVGVQSLYIITVGVFFFGIINILTSTLIAISANSFFGYKWLYIGFINLLLNLILVPLLGIEGAAWATLISYFLGVLIFLQELNKHIRVEKLASFIPNLFLCMPPFIVSIILLLFLVDIQLITKVIWCVSLLVLQVLLAFYVGLFSSEEKKLIQGLIPKNLMRIVK